MADEIIQTLGFDAGSTLATLDTLEARFNKFASALNATASAVKAFNAASSSGGGGMGSAQQRANAVMQEAARIFEATRTPQERYIADVRRLSGFLKSGAIDQDTHNRAVKQSQDVFERASKTGSKYVITLETLSRVLMTQAIVRGLNAIRDAFEFAVESQLKFSKSITEIRAIEPNRGFKEIADNVHQLSNAFNQPLQVVAEAQYQVLSNQFTSAADRANILTAANQLAKTTEDDLVGATMLLTGALNAYGESSDSAGLRSAQFFKSIELGRLRATELGTALGKVQSIGHELGVSMEELQAALVAITIGGVKASEGSTQLRGILNALLKPSQDMKKAFNELGIESGEAGVRTWELQGFLEKLRSTSGATSGELGELFRNIRGHAGAARLLAEGADKYTAALSELRRIDQATMAGKTFEAMNTDAARLTAEFNKLRNFFTVELGANAVGKLNQLISVVGGGNGLVGALRTVTTEAPIAAGAIGVLAIAANSLGRTLDTTFTVFGSKVETGIAKIATLRNALGLLAAWQVGRMGGNAAGEWINNRIAAPQEAVRSLLDQGIEFHKQQSEAAIREKDRENLEISRRQRQFLADANKVYLKDVENYTTAMKIEEKVDATALDRIMQSRQKMTRELFSISEGAAKKASEDIPRSMQDIGQRQSDRLFGETLAGNTLNNQFAIGSGSFRANGSVGSGTPGFRQGHLSGAGCGQGVESRGSSSEAGRADRKANKQFQSVAQRLPNGRRPRSPPARRAWPSVWNAGATLEGHRRTGQPGREAQSRTG